MTEYWEFQKDSNKLQMHIRRQKKTESRRPYLHELNILLFGSGTKIVPMHCKRGHERVIEFLVCWKALILIEKILLKRPTF